MLNALQGEGRKWLAGGSGAGGLVLGCGGWVIINSCHPLMWQRVVNASGAEGRGAQIRLKVGHQTEPVVLGVGPGMWLRFGPFVV